MTEPQQSKPSLDDNPWAALVGAMISRAREGADSPEAWAEALEDIDAMSKLNEDDLNALKPTPAGTQSQEPQRHAAQGDLLRAVRD